MWFKNQYIGWMMMVVVMMGITSGNILAQQAPETPTKQQLLFPTAQDDIIKILSVKPETPVVRPRGGLSGGNSGQGSLFGNQARGLGGIADDQIDEQALANAPKVGALILFDFDSATVKGESIPLLETFAQAFQSEQLRDAVFVIAGHTDDKGSAEYNQGLSKRRAEAIKQWLLTTYQIEPNRLLVKSYGEAKPIQPNDTEAGRSQNRRVEFIRIQ